MCWGMVSTAFKLALIFLSSYLLYYMWDEVLFGDMDKHLKLMYVYITPIVAFFVIAPAYDLLTPKRVQNLEDR